MPTLHSLTSRGIDVEQYVTQAGLVYTASDADQNDTVAGQTTFAATTPTFLLDIPDGTTVIPLLVSLGQTGVVAGAAISVLIEKDNADRYNTGGTTETVYNDYRATAGNNATLRSGATANAGYGVRLMGITVGQDVSPAEGASNEIIWTPTRGLDYLEGPAGFLVYTFAGTTAPTWFWTIKWAEIPSEWMR